MKYGIIMDNRVHWKNLQINETYYTRITGETFGVENPYTKVIIESIWHMPNNEAMLFTRKLDGTVGGYAVGGKFEGLIGPRNRFWKELPYSVVSNSHSACAA